MAQQKRMPLCEFYPSTPGEKGAKQRGHYRMYGSSQDFKSFSLGDSSEDSFRFRSEFEFSRLQSPPKLCFLHMPGPEGSALGFEAIEEVVRDVCARLDLEPHFVPHPSGAVTPAALAERRREVTLKKTVLDLSFCRAACVSLAPSDRCEDLPFLLGLLQGQGKPVVGFSLDPLSETHPYGVMLEHICQMPESPEPVAALDAYLTLVERAIYRAKLALD